MWKYWVPASAVTGRAVMLIGFQPGRLSGNIIEGSFEKLAPIEYRLIKKDNRVVGKFYPAAESHGLWPWMNAPTFGRDVAPHGR